MLPIYIPRYRQLRSWSRGSPFHPEFQGDRERDRPFLRLVALRDGQRGDQDDSENSERFLVQFIVDRLAIECSNSMRKGIGGSVSDVDDCR